MPQGQRASGGWITRPEVQAAFGSVPNQGTRSAQGSVDRAATSGVDLIDPSTPPPVDWRGPRVYPVPPLAPPGTGDPAAAGRRGAPRCPLVVAAGTRGGEEETRALRPGRRLRRRMGRAESRLCGFPPGPRLSPWPGRIAGYLRLGTSSRGDHVRAVVNGVDERRRVDGPGPTWGTPSASRSGPARTARFSLKGPRWLNLSATSRLARPDLPAGDRAVEVLRSARSSDPPPAAGRHRRWAKHPRDGVLRLLVTELALRLFDVRAKAGIPDLGGEGTEAELEIPLRWPAASSAAGLRG